MHVCRNIGVGIITDNIPLWSLCNHAIITPPPPKKKKKKAILMIQAYRPEP